MNVHGGAALSQEDYKVLESARQRILQLCSSIKTLESEIYQNNPLPAWSSFQTTAAILAQNVQGLTMHLEKNAELLGKMMVYPSTNYPGRTEEDILGHLLRKKLEPQVQTLVEKGREVAKGEASSISQDNEMWEFATQWIGERVVKYAMDEAGDNYTAAERKIGIDKINTGLKQDWEEDEDSSEEDDDDEMVGVGMAVTGARRTSVGQMELDVRPIPKKVDGKTMDRRDLLRLANIGIVPEHNSR